MDGSAFHRLYPRMLAGLVVVFVLGCGFAELVRYILHHITFRVGVH